MAESFGADARNYDQARPPYPADLVERITGGRSGLRVLDVGCGTGIASRQFQAAGCIVLGIDPDARMAAYAREHGLDVEVSTEPPDPVARATEEAYRRVVPDSPFNTQGRRPLELYQTGYARTAESISSSGVFESVEQWRLDWSKPYTREEWLALMPTTGGLTQLPPGQQSEILHAAGAAIDALGGSFTMEYVTLVATGLRA